MAERPRQESVAGRLEKLSLEELRDLFLRGDMAARDTLWLRLLPLLRLTAECAVSRYGRGIVTTGSYPARGVSRRELVSDALNNVFMELERYVDNVNTSIEGALKSATWGRVIDLIRRHGTRRKHEVGSRFSDGDDTDASDQIEISAAEGPTPEQLLLETEDDALRQAFAEMVSKAIDIVATGSQIGARRIAALRLRFVQRLPVEDIALSLGVSKRTAEYDLVNGPKDIARVLRDQLGVESPDQFLLEDQNDGR